MKIPSRLVLRLYAVGIAQIVLVVAVAIGIAIATFEPPPHRDPSGLLARIERVAATPAQLGPELREQRRRFGVLLSVYDAKGTLVASNVQPALPAPRADDPAWVESAPQGDPHQSLSPVKRNRGPVASARWRPGRGLPPDLRAPIKLTDGVGVLVVGLRPPRPSPLALWLTITNGLLVLGVGAFLTARSIARPLKQLGAAARALGQGDLRARTGLQRSDELGQVGKAFDEMAERIEALMIAERELLANVSHELRTPLARIRVALELAAEGDAKAARQSLAEIAVDLSELEALIDDVLTATRLELASGKTRSTNFALKREAIAPDAIVARAAQRFGSRKPERRLELTAPAGLPSIRVDPMLFRRVFDNLLENADKYSPEPEQPIALRTIAENGRVAFEVKDHGLGICEEDLPRVFEPFFRGERSRSRGTGGVGLGLTLAKRIVEAHGGSIAVQSAPGQGTVVRVEVPAEGS